MKLFLYKKDNFTFKKKEETPQNDSTKKITFLVKK